MTTSPTDGTFGIDLPRISRDAANSLLNRSVRSAPDPSALEHGWDYQRHCEAINEHGNPCLNDAAFALVATFGSSSYDEDGRDPNMGPFVHYTCPGHLALMIDFCDAWRIVVYTKPAAGQPK